MKKIIALLLALVMALCLVACGEEPAPVNNDPGTAQNEGNNEPAPNENTEIPEGWLATKTGKFYSQFTDGLYMAYEISMDGMTIKTISATKGNKAYNCSEMDGSERVTVMDGGTLYMIDHENKMVMKISAESTGELPDTYMEETDVDLNNMVNGTREIEGKTYETEEWIMEDVKSILCFDGDRLAYMIGEVEGEEAMMKILEFSDKVDDSLFAIPTDYQMISY